MPKWWTLGTSARTCNAAHTSCSSALSRWCILISAVHTPALAIPKCNAASSWHLVSITQVVSPAFRPAPCGLPELLLCARVPMIVSVVLLLLRPGGASTHLASWLAKASASSNVLRFSRLGLHKKNRVFWLSVYSLFEIICDRPSTAIILSLLRDAICRSF